MLDLGRTDKNSQGLYVDLDSLFDTRFAVLEELSPQLAIDNLLKGWQNRISDEPVGMPLDDFKTLYELRNVETLAKASQTEVADLMRHWVADVSKQTLSNPTINTIIRIFVNVFPYELTQEEATLLGNQLKAYFPEDILVTMLNVDPKRITPEVVKKYFSGMFMYDYHLWKEHHAKEGNFKDIRLPDTALYTPAIYHGQKPSESELREFEEKKIDVFKEWEMYVGPLIGIEFLPVQAFSTMLSPAAFLDVSKLEPFLKKNQSLKDNQGLKLHGL